MTNPGVPRSNLGRGWVSFCGAFCAQVGVLLQRAPEEVGFRSVMHLTASHDALTTPPRCVPKQDTLLSIVLSSRIRT